MKYKIVARKNPQQQGDPAKYYANAGNVGKMTIRTLAREISGRSSLTKEASNKQKLVHLDSNN
ncbi:MAG: hypothetical protein LBK92_03300 [Endomicrobium sp.]|jgi:hypothetical protein|nr:hypothetical protein [Endomicrobium sp.]